jgi:hypothetical protein
MRPARRHMPLVLGLMGAILIGVTSAWAAVTVSPTSLSFGSVTVGTSRTLHVTVSQKRSGFTTNVSVSISGSGAPAFSASPTRFTVPPTKTVNVTFRPTSTGTFTAIVHINAWTVTVTGTGVGTKPTPTPTPTPTTSGLSGQNPYLPLLSGLKGYSGGNNTPE